MSFMLLADFTDHIWAWIGGAVGVIFLVLIIVTLPDIIRYLRIKSM